MRRHLANFLFYRLTMWIPFDLLVWASLHADETDPRGRP